MQTGDHWIRHRVTAQGEAEVVGSAHEHIFALMGKFVIDGVQAEVEMFELRASEKEPIGSLVAISIPSHFTLDRVHDGNGLFGFLGLLQLLVFLNDNVTLLKLSLVGFNLICGEGNFTETIKERIQVICSKLVLGKAEELERSVLLEDTLELLDGFSTEVVV